MNDVEKEEKYLGFHLKINVFPCLDYLQISLSWTLFSSANFTCHVPGIVCLILETEMKQTWFIVLKKLAI